ncbi:MAG: hypothetical protein NTZ17_12465, partial [Phycisphaerae bacterium]|nr:hypothetical protein [Phycisphaerae bacterium]
LQHLSLLFRQRHDVLLFHGRSPYLGLVIPSAKRPENIHRITSNGALVKYLRCCQGAFFHDEDITTFYECVSNGNIRKGLNIFLDFIRSGHTHVDEYLKVFVQGGTYMLAFHQVFKPISRGSYFYYSSNRSCIPNIFTPTTGVSGMQISYFAKIYLMNFLAFQANKTTNVGRGFMPVTQVDQFLSALGLTGEIRKETLTRLAELELLEPDVKMVQSFGDWTYVRVTALGLYLVRVLVTRFSYIEAIMLDTLLTNLEIHKRISGLYLEGTKPSLHQRVLCARDFLLYLQNEEVLEQTRVQTSGIASQCPGVMSQIIGLATDQFQALEDLAKEDPSAQNA